MAAPRLARRLAIDGRDVMARRDQRIERRHREIGRAHESETAAGGAHERLITLSARRGERVDYAGSVAFWRLVFCSLRRMILRFSAEM